MPTLPQTQTQRPNPGPTGTREEMGSKAESSEWAAQAWNKNPDSSAFGGTNQVGPWRAQVLPLRAQGET